MNASVLWDIVSRANIDIHGHSLADNLCAVNVPSEDLGGCARRTLLNPYPISDQNM